MGRKPPINVDTEDSGVLADVEVAATALIAMAADDVLASRATGASKQT